eukprot:gene5691-6392_t
MIAHNITVHTTLNITDSPSKAYGLNYEAKILMVVALVVLILLILFGNWLVIGIFCQYRPLRTVTNYFIVSLAVADILVAVFCIPIWIAYIQTGLVEQKFGIVYFIKEMKSGALARRKARKRRFCNANNKISSGSNDAIQGDRPIDPYLTTTVSPMNNKV